MVCFRYISVNTLHKGDDDDDDVKTNMMPVTIGAIGTLSKSLRKYLSSIPGKHKVKELQKTAILGTAHILHKALM
jgi:hypothetical protein